MRIIECWCVQKPIIGLFANSFRIWASAKVIRLKIRIQFQFRFIRVEFDDEYGTSAEKHGNVSTFLLSRF